MSLETLAALSQALILSRGRLGRRVKESKDESSPIFFVLLEQVWEENHVPICPLPLKQPLCNRKHLAAS